VVVAEPDAADVVPLAPAQVEATEAQPVLDVAQLGEPELERRGHGVTLGTRLGRADRPGAPDRRQLALGGRDDVVQPPVHHIEVRLLGSAVPAQVAHRLGLPGRAPAVAGAGINAMSRRRPPRADTVRP